MYIPKFNALTDLNIIADFIRSNAFAVLISTSGPLKVPFATHLPLVYDSAKGVLRGHVARANPQWRELQSQSEVLAIFSGPHAYISPTWYEPSEKNVPTWNYSAVHVYGQVQIIEDEELLEPLLRELIAQFDTWDMSKVNPKALHYMYKAIVGFEIHISRIEAKQKLSQNRSDADINNVIEALNATGTEMNIAVAQDMQQALQRLDRTSTTPDSP